VLSDIDPELAALAGEGKVMALAFTGLGDKDRTAEALLRINKATNWNEFLEALKLYQTPTQNIVFADIKGDIGFISPGLVPVRKKGDGTMPADGASGAFDWKGVIPFEAWPKLYNPAAGYVFNANNALVGSNSKSFYGTDWEEPYRAMRLQQMFDSTDAQTLDSSAAMQADHVSLVARQLLPYLLRLKFDASGDNANPRALEALSMLRDWGGAMDKSRPEPLIFEAWLWEMHKLLLVDKAGQPLKERGPFAANSIAAILDSKDNGWCDKGAACDDVASRAFVEALAWIAARQGDNMKGWRWGKEHRALLQNKVFKHLPLLRSISDLSVASNGDFYTLDRGGSFDPPADTPFARQHGGGYRAIYDLANPDHSRFMITTGESGHIFSRHYGDLAPLWNKVKSITLSGTEAELAAQHADLLVLEPAKQGVNHKLIGKND
jgi:penicillin amidase